MTLDEVYAEFQKEINYKSGKGYYKTYNAPQISIREKSAQRWDEQGSKYVIVTFTQVCISFDPYDRILARGKTVTAALDHAIGKLSLRRSRRNLADYALKLAQSEGNLG